MVATANKDILLGTSLILSVVSLVLLFGVTWYFQSSLDLLQQQVEYDRELLFKLQKSFEFQASTRIHDVTKKQINNNTCTCQDGMPGPRGRRGEKGNRGERGRTGQKGDLGPKGQKGINGTIGDVGEKGDKGDNGDPGPRGPRGNRGRRGVMGEKGNNGTVGDRGVQDVGPKGDIGVTGMKGDKGQRGDVGDRGPQGDPGPAGVQGRIGPPGDPGPRGPTGDRGSKGDNGSPGQAGPTGSKGQKGDGSTSSSSGSVYVRWGHDKCPSTAEIVYIGRAGGSMYYDQGGGSNPQCLPDDPNYLPSMNGTLRAHMYGAEYETIIDIKNVDDQDVPCAVCHVPRNAVHMVPAKYTCPEGWVREYYGYLMASYVQFRRTQFTCVDSDFKTITGSAQNFDGYLFYPVEGKCGSLPCPPYDGVRELSCAVCTK